jgi:type I restriction enzyme M protein
MTYWAETMQDDVYMIATEGWSANPELIPEATIIQRYFAAEEKAIETLQAEQEAITAQMDELTEEHGGEGGLLEEAKTDKGKITKVSLKAFMKDVADDDVETKNIASQYSQLVEKESEAGKKAKEAQKALTENVAAKYKTLVQKDIVSLVVDDKWLKKIAADVQAELDRVSQTLAGRIKELAERYALPLPKQMQTLDELTDKVNTHLKKMGFAWK